MKVLLSIKPEYAEKIFSRRKEFEFRRSLFRDRGVKYAVVYASSPVKLVVGEFEIGEVMEDSIRGLWKITKTGAGMSEAEFFSYFRDRQRGYAIRIGKVHRYRRPVSVVERFGVRAPQSFLYLRNGE